MPIPAVALLLLKNPLVWKIAGVILLILMAFSFVAYRDHTIRKEEAAKWKVQVEKCVAATKVAIDANKSLQASADVLAKKIAEQNAKIMDLQKLEATALKARDAALAAAARKEATLRHEINRLTVIAAAPPVTVTPEVCNEAASLLRSYAVQ